MRRQRSLFFLGILLTTTFHSQSSFAQGIITQDPQVFAQKAAQFGQQIANMASQLEQSKAMPTSLTGNGNLLSNLAPGMLVQLKDVLASNWQYVYDDALGAGSFLGCPFLFRLRVAVCVRVRGRQINRSVIASELSCTNPLQP